ncbi:hypothetical protein GGI04_000200 [Coemansia thaxteri]|nr:hypothetical protein GGI04_000200 [Coemansia thaxteri]
MIASTNTNIAAAALELRPVDFATSLDGFDPSPDAVDDVGCGGELVVAEFSVATGVGTNVLERLKAGVEAKSALSKAPKVGETYPVALICPDVSGTPLITSQVTH